MYGRSAQVFITIMVLVTPCYQTCTSSMISAYTSKKLVIIKWERATPLWMDNSYPQSLPKIEKEPVLQNHITNIKGYDQIFDTSFIVKFFSTHSSLKFSRLRFVNLAVVICCILGWIFLKFTTDLCQDSKTIINLFVYQFFLHLSHILKWKWLIIKTNK